MTSINRVMLIGNIVSKPEVLETSGKKKFMKFKLETWSYRKIGGDTRKIAVQHKILVFSQKAHEFLEKVDVGTRIQLLGELTYDSQNNAEVVVSAFTGEIGPMDAEEGTADAISKPASTAASAKPSATSSFSRPAGASGFGKPSSSFASAPTAAKAGGGLGRLPALKSSRPESDDSDYDGQPSPEVAAAPKMNGKSKIDTFDSLDDEIPF